MNARQMGMGGVTAALALVIMCMGGLVPLATYILPMVCCLLLQLIMKPIGKKGGWVWYCAVSLLSMLLCPDKEAAAVFLFLGYYPLIKPAIDKKPLRILFKLFFFNAVTLATYAFLIFLLGMHAIAAEFRELGLWLMIFTIALGNLCFFLLDHILARFQRIMKKR